MDMMKQMIAIADITTTGTSTISMVNPKDDAFNNFIPCVKGKTFTTFCSAGGITSYCSVAPENISIGKYNILAITPAILPFEQFSFASHFVVLQFEKRDGQA